MAAGTAVKLLPEPTLKAELKNGTLRRVYYLYGEEDFLIRLYAGKIAQAAGADGSDGMNFLRLRGVPDIDSLSDFTESLPFFAEYKCVLITDLDAEEMDNERSKLFISLIEQLPDTAVLIISQTGLEIDDKKPKAKTKKLMKAAEEHGAVCKLSFMTLEKTAAMAVKKAERSGCTLTQQNAMHLSELCGRSLTLIQNEVEKLCSYRSSGEITLSDIDSLTPRMLDAGAYDLSECIMSGKTAQALRMLDDLYQQRVEPILIMAAVSGAFVDCYRAKLAQAAGKNPQQAAAELGYYGGRAYYFGKTFTSVKRISEQYLKSCTSVLYQTNLLLNSSKADSRILLEKAVIRISSLPK